MARRYVYVKELCPGSGGFHKERSQAKQGDLRSFQWLCLGMWRNPYVPRFLQQT